jgi:hypothetical protein
MWPRRRSWLLLVALSLGLGCCGSIDRAAAQDAKLDTLQQMFAALKRCWRAPPLPSGHPGQQITVLVSFRRDGSILGRPRITFETPGSSEADSIAYRTAVMETLQACTPLPLSPGLGQAVAGRPFTLRFDDRRNQPKPIENRAWLTTTTS